MQGIAICSLDANPPCLPIRPGKEILKPHRRDDHQFNRPDDTPKVVRATIHIRDVLALVGRLFQHHTVNRPIGGVQNSDCQPILFSRIDSVCYIQNKGRLSAFVPTHV